MSLCPLLSLFLGLLKIVFIVARLARKSVTAKDNLRDSTLCRLHLAYQASFNYPRCSILIYAEILSLANRVLRKFDLLKILLHTCEFCENRMFSRFDAVQSQIGYMAC